MDATLAPSRRFTQGWILGLLVVFFALINIQYFLKVRHSDRPNSQSAFQRWAPQVRELNDGVNIWSKYNWPNPPIMALILKPYMDVDPILLGSQFWLLTKMLCAAASIFLIFAMLDRPKHPFPLWGKLLAVVLFMRPMEGDLVHHNVNLFILMTVVGAVYALHRGWDAAAGLSLALGIA